MQFYVPGEMVVAAAGLVLAGVRDLFLVRLFIRVNGGHELRQRVAMTVHDYLLHLING